MTDTRTVTTTTVPVARTPWARIRAALTTAWLVAELLFAIALDPFERLQYREGDALPRNLAKRTAVALLVGLLMLLTSCGPSPDTNPAHWAMTR